MFEQLTKMISKSSVACRRKARQGYERLLQGTKSPAEVFSEIYQRNMWGGVVGEFYSGPGSDDEFAEHFSDLVNTIIATHRVRSVVDLGCGDFRVGRRIAGPEITYLGVDVVDALIKRNQSVFGRENVSFQCLDIVMDDLPLGDLCIVRQVLQHLSNSEVARVLAKLGRYRFAIVGEHHPAPGRLKRPIWIGRRISIPASESNSGLFLELSPFSIKSASVLARLPLPPLMSPGETLTVYLLVA